MTTSFLLIVQIVLVVVLTIAVLLQKSSSIGLGAYSGSNESVFGAKGPASFLAKTTFILGFLFIVNTITLGYMYSSEKSSSVVDAMVESTNIVAPTAIKEPIMPSVEKNTPVVDTTSESTNVVAQTSAMEAPIVPPVETNTTK